MELYIVPEVQALQDTLECVTANVVRDKWVVTITRELPNHPPPWDCVVSGVKKNCLSTPENII